MCTRVRAKGVTSTHLLYRTIPEPYRARESYPLIQFPGSEPYASSWASFAKSSAEIAFSVTFTLPRMYSTTFSS